MSVESLAIGYRRRVRNDAHCDRNLPGSGIGVGHGEKQPPAWREPGSDLSQQVDRLIDMLQRVQEKDTGVMLGRFEVFEPFKNELHLARHPPLRFGDQFRALSTTVRSS